MIRYPIGGANMRRNWNEKEEDRKKGNQFEHFVTSLFDKKTFDILEGTRHYNELRPDQLTEENKATDMKFKHLGTGTEFYVQCKYRSSMDETLEWTKHRKLILYRSFRKQNKCKFFVAVSIGENPHNPEKLYFGDLSKFHHCKMWPGTYEHLERPNPKEPIDFWKDLK